MKWLAIINPRAGEHTSEELDELSRDLRRYVGAECVWISEPNQAREAVQLHPDYDGYIAVGGDGTVAEVVNGLNGRVARLGLVPSGTGNGLARDLALNDENGAVQALSRPRFRMVDLISVRLRSGGSWQRRFLFSTSALGYMAGTVELACGPLRWCRRIRYGVAAVLQVLRQNEFVARLRFDDGEWQEHTLTTLAVQNTQHTGQFWLFPQARVDDGKLDALFGRLRPLPQLLEDLAILSKTFFFVASKRKQARKLDIELRRPDILMFEGEVIPKVDIVQYRVLPGRLRCCVPSARKR
jgi:diacylglycerol kinase family enzyme